MEGFTKDNTNQIGIDRIYKEGNTYVLVEFKFTSGAGSIGKSILSYDPGTGIRQMDDQWIDKALDNMKQQGLITHELYDDLIDAVDEGMIRKELVVVQNVPIDGNTVTESLTEEGLNIKNVHLVNIGDLI